MLRILFRFLFFLIQFSDYCKNLVSIYSINAFNWELARFLGGKSLEDDLTFVIVKVK